MGLCKCVTLTICHREHFKEWFLLWFVFLLIGLLVTVSFIAVVVIGETRRKRARRRAPGKSVKIDMVKESKSAHRLGPAPSKSKKSQSAKRRKRTPKSLEEADSQTNQGTTDVTMPPVATQPNRRSDPYFQPPEANLDATMPVANNAPQQPSI